MEDTSAIIQEIPTNKWIETDLEPDDLLALFILLLGLSADSSLYIVVGEGGDPTIKCARIHAYLKLLHCKARVHVICGLPSKTPFHGDGKEFEYPLPTPTEIPMSVSEDSISDYGAALSRFSQLPNPVFVSLKPMRELAALARLKPALVSDCFSRMSLYLYGGFNLRSLLWPENWTAELLLILNAAHRTFLYESHFAGVGNGLATKETLPTFYARFEERLDAGDPFCHTLNRLIDLWNQHTVAKIESRAQEKRRPRDEKIIQCIRMYPKQMVLADFGLAVMMHDNVAATPIANLAFDPKTGYTKFDELSPEKTSHLFVYKNVDLKQVDYVLANHF